MSSMDFVPPNMATDQDATAARLRERVEAAALKHDDWSGDFPAALDTLIQYHRTAGAVEALEAVGCARAIQNIVNNSCEKQRAYHEQMGFKSDFVYEDCPNCKALAKAKERPTPYEQCLQ